MSPQPWTRPQEGQSAELPTPTTWGLRERKVKTVSLRAKQETNAILTSRTHRPQPRRSSAHASASRGRCLARGRRGRRAAAGRRAHARLRGRQRRQRSERGGLAIHVGGGGAVEEVAQDLRGRSAKIIDYLYKEKLLVKSKKTKQNKPKSQPHAYQPHAHVRVAALKAGRHLVAQLLHHGAGLGRCVGVGAAGARLFAELLKTRWGEGEKRGE